MLFKDFEMSSRNSKLTIPFMCLSPWFLSPIYSRHTWVNYVMGTKGILLLMKALAYSTYTKKKKKRRYFPHLPLPHNPFNYEILKQNLFCISNQNHSFLCLKYLISGDYEEDKPHKNFIKLFSGFLAASSL